MAAPRSAFRALQSLRPSTLRQPLRQRILQRRGQSTATADAGNGSNGQSKFQQLWNSEVGPKTVHFWAPIMKWGVVLAGVTDFFRPAESLSLSQNAALMVTGSLWTRWCFVIRPQNYFLATVNFFLFTVGAIQTTRVLRYRSQEKGEDLVAEAKAAAIDAKDKVVGVVEDPKGAAK